MNLKEFLFYTGLTYTEFGALTGLSTACVASVTTGKTSPCRRTLRDIEIASAGIVSREQAIAPLEIPEEIKNYLTRPEVQEVLKIREKSKISV